MAIDIHEMRRRILAGESYTREELREGIEKLRVERAIIQEKTVAKRQAKQGMSDDELDDDFGAAIEAVKKEKGL